MRHLITFIVRLWVDAQAVPLTWEGQVECVTDGEHKHVRTPKELLRFIDAHTTAAPADRLPTKDR